MIVAMSRSIAAALYREIIAARPGWHSDDPGKGVVKVVITSASADGPEISGHHTTKEQRRRLADRMKDPGDELKLVIVRDMWLTGFDVPCLHTLYIDKPMRGHTLMQAIARVNRVYRDKTGGLVVDYLGIAQDLKQALAFYADSGGRGDPAETQEQAAAVMLEKLEVVSQMFHGFNYRSYFTADTGGKLAIILGAEEHILALEDGKKRFLAETSALSRAFSIAIPHDRALGARDEIAFFQAVKARLAKFGGDGAGRTAAETETVIRQLVDRALVAGDVIDIFDAAGINQPRRRADGVWLFSKGIGLGFHTFITATEAPPRKRALGYETLATNQKARYFGSVGRISSGSKKHETQAYRHGGAQTDFCGRNTGPVQNQPG